MGSPKGNLSRAARLRESSRKDSGDAKNNGKVSSFRRRLSRAAPLRENIGNQIITQFASTEKWNRCVPLPPGNGIPEGKLSRAARLSEVSARTMVFGIFPNWDQEPESESCLKGGALEGKQSKQGNSGFASSANRDTLVSPFVEISLERTWRGSRGRRNRAQGRRP